MTDKLPHDYLPIERPLETSKPDPDDIWFYENIVIKLLPDIIRLEATGIPIDLSKVKEVEKTVNNILESIEDRLKNNRLIQGYLQASVIVKACQATKEMLIKFKPAGEFLKEFDPKNKIHRAFVINTYLQMHGKEDMTMDEWSKKDLKKLNQIIASKFISDLLDNKIQSYMQPVIDKAMLALAEQKALAYNKNKQQSKDRKIEKIEQNIFFNPGSAQQKQQFFSRLGINSDFVTKTGNQQWDRKSLEQLNRLIDAMLDKKGEENDSTESYGEGWSEDSDQSS